MMPWGSIVADPRVWSGDFPKRTGRTMDHHRDVSLEELLGSSPISPLIADLREAYQHLNAASERLQEWRLRREASRRAGECGPGPTS
jgi:hypothetical protein